MPARQVSEELVLLPAKAPTRRDHNREARIQAAIVDWVRVVAPDVVIFAIPNGGLRGKAEAARFKWTGVLAGVADLCVIASGGLAFFMEVKAAGGVLSDEQRMFRVRMKALGSHVAVVRSIDDARAAFAIWGIPTREVRQ